MTISSNELLNSFLKIENSFGNANRTIIRKRNTTTLFIKWLDSKGKHVFDVTKIDVEDWLSDFAGLKISSKANYLHTVKSFYDFLLDRKYVNENPFKEIVGNVLI